MHLNKMAASRMPACAAHAGHFPSLYDICPYAGLTRSADKAGRRRRSAR